MKQQERKYPMAKKQQTPKFGTAEDFTALAAAPSRDYERNGKRGAGRPIGKRSNPAYRQYTALLRIDTHDRALEKLRRTSSKPDSGKYLETLIQEDLKK
jgi:hypothetical protein